MRDNDEMEKFQEWQEHQYNPFYWVNRFSPLFPPKRTRGGWITSLIGLFLNLPAFLAFCWSYFAEGNNESFPFMLTFGVLSAIMVLLAIRLKPDFNPGKSQTEVEERNRIQNRKKKEHPKRRKDYG
jgi:hypothetical protein